MNLIVPMNEDSDAGNNTLNKSIIRPAQVCGMEKKEIFQQAVLPVLKTLCEINSKELKSVIEDIVKELVK